MALTTIANGDNPSGTILNNNLLYLEGLILAGAAIKTGATYAALKVTAAAAPTSPFLAIPSDQDWLVLYCGNAARGDVGFITLVDFSAIS